MRTFKRCAVSRDNPEYLLRNPYTLLHQDGNKYFFANEREEHIIPQPKPLVSIKLDRRFGMSKDSPHLTRYTCVNTLTNSIWDPPPLKRTVSQRHIEPVSPHQFLRECMQRSKGDTSHFNTLLKPQTRFAAPPKKMFSLLMDRSASKDQQLRLSLTNPYNTEALQSSIGRDKDSPYSSPPSLLLLPLLLS